MTSLTLTAPTLWEPPSSVRVRGALALIAGAGESARVYERFGRRLAADGYVVGVFDTAHADAAVPWLAPQQAPHVLVGSDGGAAEVLTLAAAGAAVDGVIVAGTPVSGEVGAASDDTRRTACPVHLGVLADDASRVPRPAAGAALPDAVALAALTVPVLAVHGGADTISPFAQARTALATIPTVQLVETVNGLHDALNDLSHRSVAARIVLWLEQLRGAGIQTPIIREVTA